MKGGLLLCYHACIIEPLHRADLGLIAKLKV